LQSVALLHELRDHGGTGRGDLVVSKDESLQLLLLLVRKSLHDDLDTLVTDMVASEVEDSNSLAVGESSLELLHARKADIISLKAQDLKVLLILEGLAQSGGTIREHTVIGEPDLLDVLGGLEDLGNVTGAIRTNHVVAEVELSERGVVLNRLADGDAAVDTSLVVGHIQYQEILLVLENAGDLKSALLTKLAVSEVQVSECLVSLESLGQKLGAIRPNLVVIKQEFGQESLVVQRLRQHWHGVLGDVGRGQSDNSQRLNVLNTTCNAAEALITDWVHVQVQLRKLVLVADHLTKGVCTLARDVVVLQVE